MKSIKKMAKTSKTLSFKKYPIFSVIGITLCTIFSLMLIVPLFWALISSFKSVIDFSRNPLSFPKAWLFENYVHAVSFIEVRGNNLIDMLWNTISYTLLYATLPLIADIATAYCCARYKSKWGGIMYWVVIMMMIIPIVGSTGSSLDVSRMIGAYDNPLVAAIWQMKPGGGSRFLVCYSLFKGIDKAYSEAAFIDGAGNWKVFLTIMIPLAKNILMVYWVTSLIGYWNDWQAAMVYFPSFPTIAYGIWQVQGKAGESANIPSHLAGCVILAVPMLFLFAAIKEHLIGKISFGGLKG